jgi:hypothetical protein
MNTRSSCWKHARDLSIGDVVDTRGYGYRYHEVIEAPRWNVSITWPGQVVFTLRVVCHTREELANPKAFHWFCHIDAGTPMRVLLRRPTTNPFRR